VPPSFGSTTTTTRSVKVVLDEANPNETDDALRKLQLGTVFSPLKRTFTGLTAAAAFDLTLIDGSGETAGVANPNRLPANLVRSLRCTASGTANSVGSYVISDAAGTATSPTASTVAGIALLSDDGKTVTFPTTVTAFIISYMPRTLSTAQLAADFAPST
jgi:hypothetical protein